MIGQSDLGEQALNRLVEVGLSSQLDSVEALEADISTDPGRLLQGEIASLNIEGTGLVMKDDLRTESLTVQSNGLAIDPLKAAFGAIQLTRPTQASMVVTLTEGDIERALNSDYLDQKLQNLDITLKGKPTQITPQHISFRLPNSEQVAISADITLVDSGETRSFSFSAVPEVSSDGHQVRLKQVDIDPEVTSDGFTECLLQAISGVLDLRNFSLEGMQLQLQGLDIQPGRLELHTTARLESFP